MTSTGGLQIPENGPEVHIEISLRILFITILLAFSYLGYENVRQLILVEIVWQAQMVCQ